jgi:hypothetical protein
MKDVRVFADVRALLREKRERSLQQTGERIIATHSPVAVYGFVVWLLSFVFLAVFLAWAFALVPWPGLAQSLPSRYWAVAVPTWICVTLALVPLAYRLLSLALVPMPLEAPRVHVPAPSADGRVPPLTVIA